MYPNGAFLLLRSKVIITAQVYQAWIIVNEKSQQKFILMDQIKMCLSAYLRISGLQIFFQGKCEKSTHSPS